MYPVTSFPEHPHPTLLATASLLRLMGISTTSQASLVSQQVMRLARINTEILNISMQFISRFPGTGYHHCPHSPSQKTVDSCKKNFHSHCQLYFCLIRKVVL